jgi:hypothetical protein
VAEFGFRKRVVLWAHLPVCSTLPFRKTIQCHAKMHQYHQLPRVPYQQCIPSMLQGTSYYTLYPAMQQTRGLACCKQTFISVRLHFHCLPSPLIDFESPSPTYCSQLSAATASRLTFALPLRQPCDLLVHATHNRHFPAQQRCGSLRNSFTALLSQLLTQRAGLCVNFSSFEQIQHVQD